MNTPKKTLHKLLNSNNYSAFSTTSGSFKISNF